MQKAPGRWPGAFLFVFKISDELDMRLLEPLALVEPVRLLACSARCYLHLNRPLSFCEGRHVPHQCISDLLRAVVWLHIHFLYLRNQRGVMQQWLNMAAHHSHWLSVLFCQKITDIGICNIAIEGRIEAWPVKDHVFKTAYHLINDIAVGCGCATDGNGCLHVDNSWVERHKLHRAVHNGKNAGYFSGHITGPRVPSPRIVARKSFISSCVYFERSTRVPSQWCAAHPMHDM